MTITTVIQANTSYILGADWTAILTDEEGNERAAVGLVGEDGLGMVQLRRLSERGPQQHGVTDRGFRLAPRTISQVYEIIANDNISLQDAREYLLTIFQPRDTALSLRYDLDNGNARQIDCHFAGEMRMPSQDLQGFCQKVAISLVAPDPLWYDPMQVAVTLGASGASQGMAIPLAIPWRLGATSINQTRVVTYTGTWRTEPIVQITGPITSPVITNTVNGDKLDFTGTTIAGGTYYTIDTRYGYKTVIDSAGANQISKLTTDSDLATFALHSAPDAPGGVNTISVTGTGISSATEVYFSYYTRYVGI